MIKVREIDKPLILAMMTLVAIGFVMVYSTSYIMAMNRYGNEYFFVKKHLMFIALGLLLFFIAVLPFLDLLVTRVDYRMKRVLTFLDPWRDSGGAGFQRVQSLIAFGAGGIWGVGLGEGKQKLFYLPEAHTDFILSVIGEELGLIGVSALIILYLIILISGIRISFKAPDLFGQYLAIGITLLIVLQASVNMAVVLALLPTKGLTLPFISYGGTSLVVNMIGMGILLNIYKNREVEGGR